MIVVGEGAFADSKKAGCNNARFFFYFDPILPMGSGFVHFWKSYWFQFSGFMLAGSRFISSVVTVPVTKPVTNPASIRIAM